MSQNLNKISRQMPFGHTDYVPPDETLNFKALVPLADEIKDRLDTSPSIVLKVDAEQYSPEMVAQYEKGVRGNPLPALDYRRLPWGRHSSKYHESTSVHSSSLSPFGSANKQRRSLGVLPRTRDHEIKLPELEASYREKSALPFRIDQLACHLFDQPIAFSHAKKLKLRIGHETVLLNSPVFMESLCKRIQKELENNEEALSRQREGDEVIRFATAKKKNRYAVDEYFEGMQLPELCGRRSWLWTQDKYNGVSSEYEGGEASAMPKLPPIRHKCPRHTRNPCCFKRYRKRYKKVWAENSTKKKTSSEEGRSRIFRIDTATSGDLEDEAEEEETAGALEGGEETVVVAFAGEEEGEEEEEEEGEEEEVEEELYVEDKMSETKTIIQLYANAKGILKNSREFTNYPIAMPPPEGQEEKVEEKVEEGDRQAERNVDND